MKKLIALILLVMQAPFASAAVKYDLSLSVDPVMIRDIHQGIWLAGIKKDVVSFDTGLSGVLDKAYLGVFQAWNAEKGDPVFGLSAGVRLGDLAAGMGSVASLLGLGTVYKPLQYAGNFVHFNTFVGGRPQISHNVRDHFMYGAGVALNIPFGVSELQKGL